MHFTAFTVRVGAEQRGFESGKARPVIALRQTAEGETELLLSTDDGGLSWVDREYVQVVEVALPTTAAGNFPPRLEARPPQEPAQRAPARRAGGARGGGTRPAGAARRTQGRKTK